MEELEESVGGEYDPNTYNVFGRPNNIPTLTIPPNIRDREFSQPPLFCQEDGCSMVILSSLLSGWQDSIDIYPKCLRRLGTWL